MVRGSGAAAELREEERNALRELLRARRASSVQLEGLGLGGSARPSLAELLRRPDQALDQLLPGHGVEANSAALVEEEIKYEGYIAREGKQILRLRELDQLELPADGRYLSASGLSNEVRQKLAAVRPLNLGQASRIPGITPAALALLRVHARLSS